MYYVATADRHLACAYLGIAPGHPRCRCAVMGLLAFTVGWVAGGLWDSWLVTLVVKVGVAVVAYGA